MDSIGIKRDSHFTVLMDHIIRDEKLSKNGFLVYVALASFANKERVCYPALKAIGKRARLGISSVQEGIENLIELGYLTKENRKRENSNEYTSSLFTLNEGGGIPDSNRPSSGEQQTGLPVSNKEVEKVEVEKGKEGEAPPSLATLQEEGKAIYKNFDISPILGALTDFETAYGEGACHEIWQEDYLPEKRTKLNFFAQDFPAFMKRAEPALREALEAELAIARTKKDNERNREEKRHILRGLGYVEVNGRMVQPSKV